MTAATTPRQRRLAYLAWVAVCLIWGTTYLGIRVSLETMPPMLMGGLRWLAAGGLVTGFLVARGQRLPPPSRWGNISIIGLLLLGLGNGGVVVAEQWVPSGLTAVLVATSPFWMAFVEAMLKDGERLTGQALTGLAVGFLGILLLVWPELTATGSTGMLPGIIALQVACAGWALGSSYSRRQKRSENVLGTTALQMLAGGVILTFAGTVLGEWPRLSFSARTAWALIYLTTVGAIGGFVAYAYALRHLSVSFVSLYAYVNPVIAVALGVLLLNEPFDSRMATAAALVFAGVAIVKWRSEQPAAARRTGSAAAALVLLLVWPAAARAQAAEPADARDADKPHAAITFARFLAGGALGLGAHEGGHLLFNLILDGDPELRRVEFHGIPFFAITPTADLSPREAFVVASAGFWVQHAGSEWILSKRSGLRHERAPVVKGVLAFNILASAAYGAAALARTGPDERDTRGMAISANIDERVVGALVLAPAVLDAWRYYRGDVAWIRWASRAVKIGLVLLTFRA